MLDPARLAHQPGGRQVGGVHQQARGEREQVSAAVRLVAQDGADAQARLAQADRVADLGVQEPQQARLHPHLTGGRTLVHGALRIGEAIAHPQPAAQRIGRIGRLDLDQLRPLRAHDHTRELQGAGGLEAQAGRPLQILGRRRGRPIDGQIRRDQLPALADHGRLDPVGKEADGGDGRHRQDQGGGEHIDLATAPILPEQS